MFFLSDVPGVWSIFSGYFCLGQVNRIDVCPLVTKGFKVTLSLFSPLFISCLMQPWKIFKSGKLQKRWGSNFDSPWKQPPSRDRKHPFWTNMSKYNKLTTLELFSRIRCSIYCSSIHCSLFLLSTVAHEEIQQCKGSGCAQRGGVWGDLKWSDELYNKMTWMRFINRECPDSDHFPPHML